jgi:hypothetical protein
VILTAAPDWLKITFMSSLVYHSPTDRSFNS